MGDFTTKRTNEGSSNFIPTAVFTAVFTAVNDYFIGPIFVGFGAWTARKCERHRPTATFLNCVLLAGALRTVIAGRHVNKRNCFSVFCKSPGPPSRLIDVKSLARNATDMLIEKTDSRNARVEAVCHQQFADTVKDSTHLIMSKRTPRIAATAFFCCVVRGSISSSLSSFAIFPGGMRGSKRS